MKIKILLFSLFFTSCALASPRKIEIIVNNKPSPYKVKNFSQKEMFKTIAYILGEFKLGWLNEGWQFTLLDQYIMSKSGDNLNLSDGLTLPFSKHIFVFAYQDCLADSALVHEIAHALGYVHGDSLMEVVIEDIAQQAILDLCPPGYIGKEKPDPLLMFK